MIINKNERKIIGKWDLESGNIITYKKKIWVLQMEDPENTGRPCI